MEYISSRSSVFPGACNKVKPFNQETIFLIEVNC